MGKINILDETSSNMIAAGEVVDRPGSALKELIENSIDAGARNISVYLKNGGNSRIRVNDDGEGILREDLPKTLYRHATSKIKSGYDINGVKTLGFRGEALAAAAAVSRLEIISKTRVESMGSRLVSDETGVELYEEGCPDGTTVTIDDLFYNVPARRKFMKKDTAEAAFCISVCERLALGHPEISFSVYSDDSLKFRTSGDGKLYSVIYAIYGSQTAKTFNPVNYTLDGITVEGFISSPEFPRGTRNMQSFYINGRYIKSRTIQAALEEAYRSYIPSGKYPAAVLNIGVDYNDVDVNVHPAKTEVKFADEKKVFSAVYYAVKSVLAPKIEERKTPEIKHNFTERQSYTPFIEKENTTGYDVFSPKIMDSEISHISIDNSPEVEVRSPFALDIPVITEFEYELPIQKSLKTTPEFKIIGEAYNLYIFAECRDKIIIVDKHAAHERILYERLKDTKQVSPQTLLFPVTVTLSPSEVETLLKNSDYLNQFGFVIEEFGPSTVAVREVPAALGKIDGVSQILEGFAKDLAENSAVKFEDKVDKALFTLACKAAVKAGEKTNEIDNEYIIKNILELKLKYCPHGRPFIKEFSRGEISKYFDRQN